MIFAPASLASIAASIVAGLMPMLWKMISTSSGCEPVVLHDAPAVVHAPLQLQVLQRLVEDRQAGLHDRVDVGQAAGAEEHLAHHQRRVAAAAVDVDQPVVRRSRRPSGRRPSRCFPLLGLDLPHQGAPSFPGSPGRLGRFVHDRLPQVVRSRHSSCRLIRPDCRALSDRTLSTLRRRPCRSCPRLPAPAGRPAPCRGRRGRSRRRCSPRPSRRRAGSRRRFRPGSPAPGSSPSPSAALPLPCLRAASSVRWVIERKKLRGNW